MVRHYVFLPNCKFFKYWVYLSHILSAFVLQVCLVMEYAEGGSLYNGWFVLIMIKMY